MPTRAPLSISWLCLGVLVFAPACKDEVDAPVEDPLDDPWVDAIDSGSDPVAAAEPAGEDTAEVALEAAPASAETGPAALEGEGAVEGEGEGEGEAAPELAAKSDAVAKSGAAAKAPSAAEDSPSEAAPSAAEDSPSEVAEAAEAPAPVAIDPAPAAEPAKPAEPAEPPPITVADFEGKYRYVGGSAQRKALEQAIEKAVQQLAAVIRGIGRRRLTNTNPIDSGIEIVVNGDKVKTIFSNSGFDAEAKIDGPTISWTSDKGEKYKVRLRKGKNKIVQIIAGKDGVKTTVFVLSKDRQRLTVHHKVSSDRLKTPMTYKLSFKRK